MYLTYATLKYPVFFKPLKPGIGQYSSTSAADSDENPFLEMCIGKLRDSTWLVPLLECCKRYLGEGKALNFP